MRLCHAGLNNHDTAVLRVGHSGLSAGEAQDLRLHLQQVNGEVTISRAILSVASLQDRPVASWANGDPTTAKVDMEMDMLDVVVNHRSLSWHLNVI